MGTLPKSGTDNKKKTQRVPLFWGLLVIVAALAVIFVMTYPFIASRINRNHPLPHAEETTVRVADRLAAVPHEEQAKLAQEMFRSSNPIVRLATVEAIEDQKIHDAYPLLQQGLDDNCSAVRRRALEVLWRVDRKRGLRLLLAGLKDDDVDIRRAAITQIRFVDDKSVIPAIVPLLDDPDQTTRFFTLGVLRKLTGQPYFAKISDPPEKHQAVIRQWKRWWQKERLRWADRQGESKIQPIQPKRTDPAPSFTLRSIDGSQIRLQDLRGRWVLLHFYGTWCAPCEIEMPDLVRLRQAYPQNELVMIGVAVGETQGDRAVREWVEKFKITYPQALATPEVISAYWVPGVPVTYIIDPEGEIRYRFEGERDFETYRRFIDRLSRSATSTGSPATREGVQ